MALSDVEFCDVVLLCCCVAVVCDLYFNIDEDHGDYERENKRN